MPKGQIPVHCPLARLTQARFFLPLLSHSTLSRGVPPAPPTHAPPQGGFPPDAGARPAARVRLRLIAGLLRPTLGSHLLGTGRSYRRFAGSGASLRFVPRGAAHSRAASAASLLFDVPA